MTNTKQKTKQLSTKKGEISSKLVVDKTIKERVELSLSLMMFLEMRFGDGTGNNPIIKLAHKEIMGIITKALKQVEKQTEERVIGEMKMEEMVWAEPLVGSELETWNRAVRYFNDKINKLKRK